MTGDTGPGLRGRDRFEFTYELEPDDFKSLLASQQAVLKAGRKPVSVLQLLASMLMWLAVVVVLVWLQQVEILNPREMLVGAVGVLVGGLSILGYQRWFYLKALPRKLFELNRFVGRPHDLAVDATGVRTHVPGSTAHYEWDMVERVDDRSGRIFLWVSGMAAIIVPGRVFASAEERAAFLAAVKEWADAKN